MKENIVSNNNDVVVMIPAYNPDEKFIQFLSELSEQDYRNIIVIDDGSKTDSKHLFKMAKEKYGCRLITHAINLGQGRAYKSGFNCYLTECGAKGDYESTIGIIQCDCDGQHHVEDINRCAGLLRENPKKFILGIRDFSDKSIPFRSRFGNNCTNFVFKVFCRINVKDTQTGLKGIPRSLIPILMETTGERFEYASSVLLNTKKQNVEILQFSVKTIYINGNETSHFKPVLDSIRIYLLILKYLFPFLSVFFLDIAAFSVFIKITTAIVPDNYIIISAYMARVVSCIYSFLLKKNIVYEKRTNGIFAVFKSMFLYIV